MLGDLRAAQPLINEQLKPRPKQAGDEGTLRYRIRNSSKKDQLYDVTFTDTLPEGLDITSLDESCALADRRLTCSIGEMPGGERLDLTLQTKVSQLYLYNVSCPNRLLVLGVALADH